MACQVPYSSPKVQLSDVLPVSCCEVTSRPRVINPKRSKPSAWPDESNAPCQTLLGITGSGKTFTVAHVIQRMQWPTLIIAPNKTLAAQLYGEMRDLFPENAVAYFVSYYDYYQPEAYIPTTDTFIEKDAIINDQDRSHAARRNAGAALAQ